MKSGLFKRILAMTMMAVLLVGDVLPTFAETVSGGDAVVVEGEDTVNNDEQAEGTEDIVNPNPDVTEGDGEETSEELTDETTSVSDGDAEVVEIEEEETPLDASMLTTLEPVTVDGITITVSGPKTAFAEGTTVSAVAVEPTEVVIAAAEENEQAVVKKYKAFDINLVLDGEFVQPLNGEEITVNFEGDMLIPDTDNNEDVAVYHVDEDDNLTKMDAAVAEVENEDAQSVETVEMTTTHFSVYIIAILGEQYDQHVTFNHYLGTPQSREMIYVPSEMTVKKGESFYNDELPLQGEGNYVMTQFVVTSDGKKQVYNNANNNKEIKVNLSGKENVIDIYYKEAASTDVITPTFFDYYVDDVVPQTFEYEVEEFDEIFIYQNASIPSVTYNGTTYTGLWYMPNGNYCIGRWKNGNLERTIVLKYGMKFESITIQHLWGSVTYNNVIFKESKLYKVKTTTKTETVMATRNGGINRGYDNSEPFLAMGITNSTDAGTVGNATNTSSHSGFAVINDNGKYVNFNSNNTHHAGIQYGDYAIASGLITELTGSNYDTLVMGKAYAITEGGYYHPENRYKVNSIDASKEYTIQEPGYFTKNVTENCEKAVLENYELNFKVTGNTYSLDYVENTDNGNKTMSWSKGTPWTQNGKVNKLFLPLNDAEKIGGRTEFQPYNGSEGFDNSNNYYFGMRADFEFSLGDYIGPLTYEFYGDDDLWVFVDGHRVLDLGGLHSAYKGSYTDVNIPTSVDLWKEVFELDTSVENWWKSEAYEKLDKKASHQVTILFMERGGFESTCAMRFVIPNVSGKDPVISNIPKANLELVKKDSETKKVIGNVGFKLYKDDGVTLIGNEKITGPDGKVTFENLKAGTYYLKETKWADGYVVDENNQYKVTVSLSADKKTATASIEGLKRDTDGAFIVYNTPVKKVDVKFKKIYRYNHDTVLEGAKFVLLDENKQPIEGATAVSGANGYFSFTGLQSGIYYLQETEAPTGYIKYDKLWKFKVDADYKANGKERPIEVLESPTFILYEGETFLVKNEKSINLTIEKKWEDANGNEIKGSEVEVSSITVDIYRKHESKSCNESGKIYKENVVLSKENNWTYTIEGLPERDDCEAWIYYAVEKDVAGYDYKGQILSQKVASQNGFTQTLAITNVQKTGALKIVKNVDKVDTVHGDATFTFKITCPDNSVLYRTMIFTAAGKQETTIENLPAGSYIVEELDALRYECKSDKVQEKAVIAGADEPTVYEYSNEKVFENYYSHTDTVINVVTFERNEDGTITGSTITQQTVTVNE